MSLIELSQVRKSFGSGAAQQCILDGVDLKVETGEFVAIVGFSGAGKTTLISMLAGLEKPDEGVVLFRDRELVEPDPNVGVVFQSYSLMPWLTVRGNIALGVSATQVQMSAAEQAEQVTKYMDMVGLSHASDRRPAELSGGMRQRVAVARALATQPEVLLMDEPLSALDALTRARLQDEFAEISAREKSSIVLITNDVDEALLLADRVIALTPAPAATLGREFVVNIAKPRDRAALNSDGTFISLRAEIIRYLLSLGVDIDKDNSPSKKSAPNLIPIEIGRSAKKKSREEPPTLISKSAKSTLVDRFLIFSQTGKTYPTAEGPLTVVKDFELDVHKGEFITLIGHSGCGKSTVLSMTAGLNDISAGGIILDGSHITSTGPDRAVVFQAPSLMPWMTAFENVEMGVDRVYPLADKSERRDMIEYYLERVGLADSMHRSASDLSNGMKQRVGIARAFALSPKLLLLDEPFGMLDSLTRWKLQDVLMDVWEKTNVTTICVTHDVDEAILLADRVVMMSNGPQARVGNIMNVDLPRPRARDALLSHPDYYAYREELLDFLEAYEGGANPSAETLKNIEEKRSQRIQRPKSESAA